MTEVDEGEDEGMRPHEVRRFAQLVDIEVEQALAGEAVFDDVETELVVEAGVLGCSGVKNQHRY
jgi:hypothetical protein